MPSRYLKGLTGCGASSHWCQNKEAGTGQQRAERAQRIGNGLLIGEIIASVDHEVRLQGVEGEHPGNLGLLAGDHMQIGQMQQPKFRLTAQRALGQEGSVYSLSSNLVSSL